MTEFAILLRGINVGAHNRIKMADLKKVLEEAGFEQVSTHIQSGNVRASFKGKVEDARKAAVKALSAHGLKNPLLAVLKWTDLEKLVAEKPYRGRGPEYRKLAHFTTSPLEKPGDLVGEHGVMQVIAAKPEVIFTLAKMDDTPGMKGMDNLEKVHKIPTTGRFWNVIEDWVAKQP